MATVLGIVPSAMAAAGASLTGRDASPPASRPSAASTSKGPMLERGGSDAFVVVEDADLDMAVATDVRSRFMNAGQSCIAAKRFIVVDAIAAAFVARLRTAIEARGLGLECLEHRADERWTRHRRSSRRCSTT